MRESGEALVECLGVSPGIKVLDVGCGDGTTALPAAKRGAEVLGVEIASDLVEAGNKRAADLERELRDLFHSQNRSASEDVTSIPATFLRVTVAR